MKDRTGRSLDSGGDVEIGYAACNMGLGVGVFPELRVTHLIPKERLSEEYLARLVAGIVSTNIMLQYKWHKVVPISPFSGVLGLPRVIRNVLGRKGIRRRMYLAELRSQVCARAIILEQETRKS